MMFKERLFYWLETVKPIPLRDELYQNTSLWTKTEKAKELEISVICYFFREQVRFLYQENLSYIMEVTEKASEVVGVNSFHIEPIILWANGLDIIATESLFGELGSAIQDDQFFYGERNKEKEIMNSFGKINGLAEINLLGNSPQESWQKGYYKDVSDHCQRMISLLYHLYRKFKMQELINPITKEEIDFTYYNSFTEMDSCWAQHEAGWA